MPQNLKLSLNSLLKYTHTHKNVLQNIYYMEFNDTKYIQIKSTRRT